MKLTIIATARHRNGVHGAPFDVVLFQEKGRSASRKVGIVFDLPHCCAVLDVAMLAAGDIAFGSNSWRGDHYEDSLRRAVSIDSTPHHQTAVTTPTNQERAARCQEALTHYCDYDSYTNLVDLLADAMRWCCLNDRNFEHALADAQSHYQTERINETGVLP
jgi:hypothetical protein